MTPTRILLVDDEELMLRSMKTILERGGYATEAARDGKEAMAMFESRPFDVIVSDINMPGYGGLQFLRGIRDRDPDVPVIMLTGKPTLESSSRALEYGAFRYLMKPIVKGALTEAVENAVAFHETARLKRTVVELHQEDAKLVGERIHLNARFDKAIELMWMAFQPIVSSGRREVFGYEALLRSTEPTLSNPAAFLSAAERLGRLRDLGRAIREKLSTVSTPGNTKLFVNLHANDLLDEQLFHPAAPLSRIAERVVLEVTERAAFDDIKDIEARIAKLRQLGYKIAVDDLGAGYAGLTSLTRLEPDFAKLDMGLVRNVNVEPKKQAIVRSMAHLSVELGISVVAEGVETAAEHKTILECGCDLLQGYLFGKPAPEMLPPIF